MSLSEHDAHPRRAWLTPDVPRGLRPTSASVIYLMQVGPEADLEWYVQFRSRLRLMDDRIQLPLWPEANKGTPSVVRVDPTMSADDVVAYFDFAAGRGRHDC